MSVSCLSVCLFDMCTCCCIESDLAGPGMMDHHCTVEHVDGVVMLHPKQGECYINYDQITEPSKLNQGDATFPSSQNVV